MIAIARRDVSSPSNNSSPGVDRAVRLARRTFISGHKIDMGELAAQLGVNRATLFRWVGDRDKFLALVIWSVTDPTIDIAIKRASGSGGSRIAETLGRFAAMANQGYFHEFLRREPERALRIMTTRAFEVQHRIVERIEALLIEEVEKGNMFPPLPIHDLAFLLVRITESFVYTTVISGEKPDALKVWQAAAALLGAPVPTYEDAAAVLASAEEWS